MPGPLQTRDQWSYPSTRQERCLDGPLLLSSGNRSGMR
jgi:hypothetical protein